jgi:hypothetical protein
MSISIIKNYTNFICRLIYIYKLDIGDYNIFEEWINSRTPIFTCKNFTLIIERIFWNKDNKEEIIFCIPCKRDHTIFNNFIKNNIKENLIVVYEDTNPILTQRNNKEYKISELEVDNDRIVVINNLNYLDPTIFINRYDQSKNIIQPPYIIIFDDSISKGELKTMINENIFYIVLENFKKFKSLISSYPTIKFFNILNFRYNVTEAHKNIVYEKIDIKKDNIPMLTELNSKLDDVVLPQYSMKDIFIQIMQFKPNEMLKVSTYDNISYKIIKD